MVMSWEIRAERPEDGPLVDALNEQSFGAGRYAKAAYRLREGVNAQTGLSFIAVEEGTLRGSVRFWPITIGTQSSLLLGPLAVQSDQRGRGIGIALMKKGIEAAKAGGHRSIVLVGDAPYYARVGFTALPHKQIVFPGPADPSRILGLALVDGALENLRGTVMRAHLDDPVCADGAGLG